MKNKDGIIIYVGKAKNLKNRVSSYFNSTKKNIKTQILVSNIDDIEYVLDKAIYLALNGRKGPVWIDIPINLQAAMIDETKLKKYDKNEDEIDLPSINDEILKLKELLNSSNNSCL